MNEELQKQETSQSTEPVAEEVTAVPLDGTETLESTTSTRDTKRRRNLIIGAVVVVAVLLLAVWYVMERTNRVDTSLFSFIEKARMERQVVASVNGVNISAYDLTISEQQIGAAAAAQGLDLSDPDVQKSIKEQALEMLINTELLRQEAINRGISVSDEEVAARYEQLVQEVGGEAILKERMKQFGVTQDILMRDIRNELTIQALLDEVFETATMDLSEEEIAARYELAGGEEAGLPPLAEVKDQIEAQLAAEKEQTVVNDFVETLRNKATIDIQIEI